MLKQLTWHYVILNPNLASQQHGQKAIIRGLFRIFCDAAGTDHYKDRRIFPHAFREQLNEVGGDKRKVVRIISDLISSLTEKQACSLYRRLSGVETGSSLH